MTVVTLATNALGCLVQVREKCKQNPRKYMNLEWIFHSYVYFGEQFYPSLLRDHVLLLLQLV